jgi:adenine-specific DNA-methyltransferase
LDGLGSIYKIEGIGEDGLGYRYYTSPQRKNATKGKMFSGVPTTRVEEIEEAGESIKVKSIVNYYDYSADFGNIRHEGGVNFPGGKKPIKLLKKTYKYTSK